VDSVRYAAYQEDEFHDLEAKCRCCGSEDKDPCENLAHDPDNNYYCRIYNTRLGLQKTVSGKIFNCVSINELIRRGSLKEVCAYKEM